MIDEEAAYPYAAVATELSPADFEATLRNPEAWIEAACELRRAARILHNHWLSPPKVDAAGNAHFPKPAPWGLALLLGFATENALKSLYVVRKPNSIVGGRLRFTDGTNEVSGHALNDVAKAACLTVDDREEQLLNFLETATLSFGRYPTATTAKRSPKWRIVHTSLFVDADRLMLRAMRTALNEWSHSSSLTRGSVDATMKYIESDSAAL